MFSITKFFTCILFLLVLCTTTTISFDVAKQVYDDTICGSEWIAYKDEKCFKLIDNETRTFEDGEKICAKVAPSGTLPIIHSQAEQDLLINYVFRTLHNVNNAWIGAQYSSNQSSYVWSDQSNFDYTNWDSGRKVENETNRCLEMQSDDRALGKWIDEPCMKKNLVICQKSATWTITDLQRAVLAERKQSRDEAQQLRDDLKQSIDEIKEKLQNDIIPLGFIYVQISDETSPNSMWPSMNWHDVSNRYANLFFRVTGNAAGSIGQVQEESCPRITKVDMLIQAEQHSIPTYVNYNDGYSDFIHSGDTTGQPVYLRFYSTSSEVRPRNTAIRIWQRTG